MTIKKPVDQKIQSVTQWKKTYLPEMVFSESLDLAVTTDNHVGALLAARVMSQSQSKERKAKA
jgi:hypothetical protein